MPHYTPSPFVASCACAAVFIFAGCDASAPASDTPKPTPSAATELSTPGTAQSGYATGRILGTDGAPIQIAGAQVSINIQGVSSAGERVSYNPSPKPDGTYRTRLADGVYHVPTARLQIVYSGEKFAYNLVALNGPMGDTDSSDGLYCDFVWRINGPIPLYEANPEESTHTHWFGGSIGIQYLTYREDTDRGVRGPEDGSRFAFRLQPHGPIIDGSTSEELARELVLTNGWIRPSALHDIPAGKYTLTGSVTEPGGQPTTLEFEIGYDEFADSQEIFFTPGSYGGLNPVHAAIAPKGW